MRARIQPTEGPRTPQAFDYRQYLHFQNMHFQSFVKAESIQAISKKSKNQKLIDAVQNKIELLKMII
ncbi:MAG: DUF4131 domain-containing protein [bacterium]